MDQDLALVFLPNWFMQQESQAYVLVPSFLRSGFSSYHSNLRDAPIKICGIVVIYCTDAGFQSRSYFEDFGDPSPIFYRGSKNHSFNRILDWRLFIRMRGLESFSRIRQVAPTAQEQATSLRCIPTSLLLLVLCCHLFRSWFCMVD